MAQPYVIVEANIFAAPTRAEGEYLASSHRQRVSRLYTGEPGLLPRPDEGYMEKLAAHKRYRIAQAMACTAIGNTDDVGSWLRQFIETTQAVEVIIETRIYGPQACCRSYQIAA